METRCPGGAGQRQRSWLGAEHDSPDSRQGSRPASAKPDREHNHKQEQEQEQEQEAYYHRQAENTTHWPDKPVNRHE
ncbi:MULTISPECIES: hypothetical protein [Citrobacter]|uniref:hypothetical protein n=1 Tax=Citrobacter TaxID=544 RepID=UPI001656DACD|nr:MULTISPECIES: hypothetical protein [Citrobacter]MDT7093062.1 hypothetical protein [Citrobacter freundii]